MNESAFSRDLRKSIEQHYQQRVYVRKIVAGQFSMVGIPDILGCIHGRFFAIECKQIKSRPARETSILWKDIFKESQIQNLQAIKTAGGLAYGIIHLPYLSPRLAMVLTPESIKGLPCPTVKDLATLVATRRNMFIHKKQGLWDVSALMPHDPSTITVPQSDS
jgi:hypothetical protein